MEIIKRNINKIKPDKDQPRKKTGFEKESMEELSDSIKQVGIIIPILIQKNGLIVDGERRFRAAKKAGFKEVPIVYDNNLTPMQRLEYQLICSLNSTSCAEEEIAPKIKEYIDKSGYTEREAAQRLGKSHGYIGVMIKTLANLSKEEKGIIALWRKTKGDKGIAPSNLAELKQQHPDKKDEIIELAKEEVISRSDLRELAKEKKQEKEINLSIKTIKDIEETNKDSIKIIKTGELINNLRSEIVNAEKDMSRFIYKVRVIKFSKLKWNTHKEQSDFVKFIEHASKKAESMVSLLDSIKLEIGI